MDKYRVALDRRIESYLGSLDDDSKLDFLFISHAHFDHVSGLTKLLDTANGGVQADTIIMPLMDVYDRLIVFARAASEDAGAAQDSFYQAFASDPVEALQRFNPRRILLVKRGIDPDGDGAPGGDGTGEPGPFLGESPIPAKLIGIGAVEPRRSVPLGTELMVIPDTKYLALSVETVTWLLSPFVDPTVNADRSKFRATLAHELMLSVRSLGQWLRSPRNRMDLLTNKLGSLEKAYKAVKSNINITSMCLFSGPLPDLGRPSADFHWVAGKFKGHEIGGKIAWLATGDAALAHNSRRRAMLKHYRRLLPSVLTLTLPHHGATANFHDDLVRLVDPHFCVASADHYHRRWQHPGAQVVHSVASHGSLLFTVTASARSEFREYAFLR
ncbi:MBL fold metallo-hydrolase [Rhizobium sp. L245/93]|uniref:MBL fold metallo-hydrolase n=1 Tax=Rhizobium sp. L245/93 TaxID=2819998 RepID=UPI001ADA38E2|nr:MBL fold metallo-hydrolase [Rhizobium sp. L245/93]MBO9166784.1 MBL fold metallo-hydrolase [Rhizobium sp. L245/93]